MIDNYGYTSNSQAIGRSLRLLSKYIPKKIKIFTIILSETDIPNTKLSVNRNEVEVVIDDQMRSLLQIN